MFYCFQPTEQAGKTAVFIAVELNFTRIAEALINAGADVNTADDVRVFKNFYCISLERDSFHLLQ